MKLLDKILGPKSKYDQNLPYTYEARVPIAEGSEEYNSYFSDTICGLVEYLHDNEITPDRAQILEIYRETEKLIDAQYFTTPDRQWRFKPDICRAFEVHYKGHIQDHTCSFKDRNKGGYGP